MEQEINENEIIAGGISGAISDPLSKRATSHAKMYYEEIRKNHADVKRIAVNTGFTSDQIMLIKNYLFFDLHELYDGVRRFDVSFEIAESWRRLAFDPENIKPHDITLLHHELMELKLVSEGVPQDEAHIITSRKYNYSQESFDYYQSLQITVDHDEGTISGAITMLQGNTH